MLDYGQCPLFMSVRAFHVVLPALARFLDYSNVEQNEAKRGKLSHKEEDASHQTSNS